ncbi:type IV secretion system protein VirB1 [Burkholderia latens]|uniref:lytic transglycosylase domain-containing protein n=1 Tax=Burkholderia latens TaxID=488446 RepID=UPI0039A51278
MRKSFLLIGAALVALPLCGFVAPKFQQATASGAQATASGKIVPMLPTAASEAAAPIPLTQSPAFATLAAECAPTVHIRTLAALVRHESSLNRFAINVNGGEALSRQPVNESEAIATAQALLDQGRNIDVGLAQINSGNFRALGIPLAKLFDPCESLRAGARILSDCYERAVAVSGQGQDALHAALSCYNTGTLTAGLRNGYVRKVVAQARLPVPELLPDAPTSNSDRTAPVVLQAKRATSGAASQTIAKNPKPADEEGEPDVFSARSNSGAFTAARVDDAGGADTHQN